MLYFRSADYQKYQIKPQQLTKRVEIVNVVSGMSDELIRHYVNQNVDGLIIEAFGRGNVPANLIESFKLALEKGIVLVLTSRCPMGRIRDSYAYPGGGYQLKQIGLLSGNSLPSYKARLLLMMVLSAGLNPQDFFK